MQCLRIVGLFSAAEIARSSNNVHPCTLFDSEGAVQKLKFLTAPCPDTKFLVYLRDAAACFCRSSDEAKAVLLL